MFFILANIVIHFLSNFSFFIRDLDCQLSFLSNRIIQYAPFRRILLSIGNRKIYIHCRAFLENMLVISFFYFCQFLRNLNFVSKCF